MYFDFTMISEGKPLILYRLNLYCGGKEKSLGSLYIISLVDKDIVT